MTFWSYLWSYLIERPLVESLGSPPRRAFRHAYQHDFSIALLSAAAFHLAVMLTGLGVSSLLSPLTVKDDQPGGPGPIIIELDPRIGVKQAEGPKVPQSPHPPRRPKAPWQGIPVAVPVAKPDTTPNVERPLNDVIHDLMDEGREGEGDRDGEGMLGGNGNGRGGGGDGEVDGDGAYPPADTFLVVEVEPKLIAMEAPEYPELAKMAQIEGTVVVRVLVAKDGRVKKTVLLKSAHALLDQAALAASREARFTPAIQHREPVATWVNIPFRFSLH